MLKGLEFSLSGDQTRLLIKVPGRKTLIQMTANEAEELLETVGHIRAQMQPQPSVDYVPTRDVTCVFNPRWFTHPDPMEGDSLLHIRDNRFGWLHYSMPQEEARHLGTILLAQANEKPLQTPSGGAH